MVFAYIKSPYYKITFKMGIKTGPTSGPKKTVVQTYVS